MAFTLLIFLALLNAFIFIYFKQKTLRYKILTSVMVCVLAILLFYIVVIFLWNSSTDPAESRLQDREATILNSH
jgi:uncharacterized membrane-anchored protein